MTAENEELLRAYALTFNSEHGQIVLADLAPFCRAVESCLVLGDTHATAALEGRREVFLRITQYARLTEEEILTLRLSRINKPGDQNG